MNDVQNMIVTLKQGEERLLEVKSQERFTVGPNKPETGITFRHIRHGRRYRVMVTEPSVSSHRQAEQTLMEVIWYQPNRNRRTQEQRGLRRSFDVLIGELDRNRPPHTDLLTVNLRNTSNRTRTFEVSARQIG